LHLLAERNLRHCKAGVESYILVEKLRMVEEKKDEMVQPLALKLRVANGIVSASA
jgi:hypothetical protein